jgi:hypothetical protein
VKFSETATEQVALAKTGQTGHTGISSVDELSKAAGVVRFEPVFRGGSKFEARHREYGLHRWYRFFTDGTFKIGDILPGFRADPNIVAAEFQPIPTNDVLSAAAPTSPLLLADDSLLGE